VKNIPKAIEISEKYSKEDLQRVLLIYAEQLFEARDINNFEAVIIRAEKPEIALEMYKVGSNYPSEIF